MGARTIENAFVKVSHFSIASALGFCGLVSNRQNARYNSFIIYFS